MKKNIYEILDEFINVKSKEDKINILRMNNSYALETILKGTFHPGIKFVFKEEVPYKRIDVPPGMAYNNMTFAVGKTYLFEEGHPNRSPNLTMERTKQLLQQVLEGLEPKEADVYMNMILKNQKIPTLSYALVKEAFPNLLP